MARPTRLDLRAPDQAWRRVPMPGANLGIDLVRLQSPEGTSTMLCRFPAGFERAGPGGYLVAEEFLVLDGALEVEGTVVHRGALCAIPAGWERTRMHSPRGCTVLAWWSGPADYRPPAELSGRSGVGLRVVQALDGAGLSPLLRTGDARWEVVDALPEAAGRAVDVVDLALSAWARVEPGEPVPVPAGPLLVRVPDGRGDAG